MSFGITQLVAIEADLKATGYGAHTSDLLAQMAYTGMERKLLSLSRSEIRLINRTSWGVFSHHFLAMLIWYKVLP